MARVVTKYNPYMIQKLIQTSRVSTLQVVLVLGSISLLVGGLLWLISGNDVLFVLSFALVALGIYKRDYAIKHTRELRQSACDMVAEAVKQHDLSDKHNFWVNEWHAPIFAVFNPVNKKVFIGSVWSGQWELHDFSWVQRWESAAERSYSFAGSSSGSSKSQYYDPINGRSSGSHSTREYGVSMQGYDSPRVVLWVDDLSQPSRVLYVSTMHEAKEWCARIKLMFVDGRTSI